MLHHYFSKLIPIIMIIGFVSCQNRQTGRAKPDPIPQAEMKENPEKSPHAHIADEDDEKATDLEKNHGTQIQRLEKAWGIEIFCNTSLMKFRDSQFVEQIVEKLAQAKLKGKLKFVSSIYLTEENRMANPKGELWINANSTSEDMRAFILSQDNEDLGRIQELHQKLEKDFGIIIHLERAVLEKRFTYLTEVYEKFANTGLQGKLQFVKSINFAFENRRGVPHFLTINARSSSEEMKALLLSEDSSELMKVNIRIEQLEKQLGVDIMLDQTLAISLSESQRVEFFNRILDGIESANLGGLIHYLRQFYICRENIPSDANGIIGLKAVQSSLEIRHFVLAQDSVELGLVMKKIKELQSKLGIHIYVDSTLSLTQGHAYVLEALGKLEAVEWTQNRQAISILTLAHRNRKPDDTGAVLLNASLSPREMADFLNASSETPAAIP